MGLRKIGSCSVDRIRSWLAREPLFNLFLLSGLAEGLGPNLVAWEQRDTGVLMRRGANWLLDAGSEPAAFDFLRAAAVVDGHRPELVRAMVGLPTAVEPLHRHLRKYSGCLVKQTFAAVTGDLVSTPNSGNPRPARPEDRPALTALYADAGDMSRSPEAVRAMLPRTWVTEAGGEIVAAAHNSGRTSQAAMIGAVFTLPQHRGKGYGSTVVHALSAALLAEGLRPCLFYDNPAAGRIYLRQGYVPLGPWEMVTFAPVPAAHRRSESPPA